MCESYIYGLPGYLFRVDGSSACACYSLARIKYTIFSVFGIYLSIEILSVGFIYLLHVIEGILLPS